MYHIRSGLYNCATGWWETKLIRMSELVLYSFHLFWIENIVCRFESGSTSFKNACDATTVAMRCSMQATCREDVRGASDVDRQWEKFTCLCLPESFVVCINSSLCLWCLALVYESMYNLSRAFINQSINSLNRSWQFLYCDFMILGSYILSHICTSLIKAELHIAPLPR